MPGLSPPKNQVIVLKELSLRLEPAEDCDGSACHMGIHDETVGQLFDLPPHMHMVEREPDGRTRSYAITLRDELLADLYQREVQV